MLARQQHEAGHTPGTARVRVRRHHHDRSHHENGVDEATYQKQAQTALRRYAQAFEFEHRRRPSTDEDWLPMRRTRAAVLAAGGDECGTPTAPTVAKARSSGESDGNSNVDVGSDSSGSSPRHKPSRTLGAFLGFFFTTFFFGFF